jgi:hypothetical protein
MLLRGCPNCDALLRKHAAELPLSSPDDYATEIDDRLVATATAPAAIPDVRTLDTLATSEVSRQTTAGWAKRHLDHVAIVSRSG